MNSCVFTPKIGGDLFKKLRGKFSYTGATTLFTMLANPRFAVDHKDELDFIGYDRTDPEHITQRPMTKEEMDNLSPVKGDVVVLPTFESLMEKMPNFVNKVVGEAETLNRLNKQYPQRDNTIENYGSMLEIAYQFNTSDPQKGDYIATVETTDDNKLKIKFQKKTNDAVVVFNNQYSSHRLNKRLASIFSPVGVTVGRLTQVEVQAGRIGVTDFSKVKEIGNDFTEIIKVANNAEGHNATSEEFAHLLIGIFKDNALVQRALQTLKNNKGAVKAILKDDYQDTVDFYDGNMDLVVEEALGHILQQNLLKHDGRIETPSPALFERTYDWIVNQFKDFNADEVVQAIAEADIEMSDLAKQILSGELEITKEAIIASKRNVQLNALSDRIERNIKILKNASATELKRATITKDKGYERVATRISTYTKAGADTVQGICFYAKSAIDEIKQINIDLETYSNLPLQSQLNLLRRIRRYYQSYTPFLESIASALVEERNWEDDMFNSEVEFNGVVTSVAQLYQELLVLNKDLQAQFKRLSTPTIKAFVERFVGKLPDGIDIEKLFLEADKDISSSDRWLDSMANSSSVLLQLFDRIVKQVNYKVRQKSLKDYRRVQALRQKAEDAGLTDFEWMFERDENGDKTGNYISEYNIGLFWKNYRQMLDDLDEKYGKNPSGEDALKKIAERNNWIAENSVSPIHLAPNDNYKNQDFENLSDTQKEIRREFLELKSEFDNQYGIDQDDDNKSLSAIQIRKSNFQRVVNSLSSPSAFIENAKESIKATFMRREDDDSLFGASKTKGALRDFDGSEFMLLPKLYLNKLENANELTTDIFGSLLLYSYASNQFAGMESAVDALEVGRNIAHDELQVIQTVGAKQLAEKIGIGGNKLVQKVLKQQSNILERLDDFMAAQVYKRYLEDSGTIGDTGIDKQKATSFMISLSAMAQLGFNFLAQGANVTLGKAMQRIEAAASQYFGYRELVTADGVYAKELLPFLSELNSRTKHSKLALFNEFYDIKQEWGRNLSDSQKKSIVERVFGHNVLFIGQTMGDHWLYNRTAIAMAKKEQVLLNGHQMSLWDALEVVDAEEGGGQKRLNTEDIKNLDGTSFDHKKFSEKVNHVNHYLFGIYNEEDSSAANRVIIGRLCLLYRKWMKPTFNRLFQEKQMSLELGEEEEGYYRTLGRVSLQILRELKRGEFQYQALKESLTEQDKANLRRCLMSIVQYAIVYGMARFLKGLASGDKKKKRPFALKLANYFAQRLAHELGGVTPSTVMGRELIKTVQSPTAVLNAVNDTFNLLSCVVDPTTWVDEIQTGPYKGMSTLEKRWIKAPIPGVSQYRAINKFIDIDNSTLFYLRQY